MAQPQPTQPTIHRLSTFTNDMCAVLIGVDDYSAFDPSGKANLRGSVNDVRTWCAVLADLGVNPGNVHIFVSPKPADAATLFPGATVMEATHANVVGGLGKLGDALAQGSTGLLTYSGHGDFEGSLKGNFVYSSPPNDPHKNYPNLALCPTDVKIDHKNNVVDNLLYITDVVNAFRARPVARAPERIPVLGKLPPLDNLTVVLDCCFAGGAATRSGVLSLNRQVITGKYKEFDIEVPPTPPVDIGRLLMACKADEPAYQSDFMGQSHGAFTWALTSSATQWAKVHQTNAYNKGTTLLHLTYDKAITTAMSLLIELSYTQTPQVAPNAIRALCLFQDGKTSLFASNQPDGGRITVQFDGGLLNYVKYDLTISSNLSPVAYGHVLVSSPRSSYTGPGQYYIATDKELWVAASSNTSAALLNSLQSGQSGDHLTLTPGADMLWPIPNPDPQTIAGFDDVDVAWMNRSVDASDSGWRAMSGTPTVWSDGTVGVSFSAMTCRLNGDGTYTWGGKVLWYYVGTSSPSAAIISHATTTTLSRQTISGSWMVAEFSVTGTHLSK